jgi:hypothetical protein
MSHSFTDQKYDYKRIICAFETEDLESSMTNTLSSKGFEVISLTADKLTHIEPTDDLILLETMHIKRLKRITTDLYRNWSVHQQLYPNIIAFLTLEDITVQSSLSVWSVKGVKAFISLIPSNSPDTVAVTLLLIDRLYGNFSSALAFPNPGWREV